MCCCLLLLVSALLPLCFAHLGPIGPPGPLDGEGMNTSAAWRRVVAMWEGGTENDFNLLNLEETTGSAQVTIIHQSTDANLFYTTATNELLNNKVDNFHISW